MLAPYGFASLDELEKYQRRIERQYRAAKESKIWAPKARRLKTVLRHVRGELAFRRNPEAYANPRKNTPRHLMPVKGTVSRKIYDRLHHLKHRADKNGMDFDITPAKLLSPFGRCPITLRAFTDTGMDSRSVDRLDNDAGYVEGNKFVISRRANVIKRDRSPERVRELLAKALHDVEILTRLLAYMEKQIPVVGEYK